MKKFKLIALFVITLAFHTGCAVESKPKVGDTIKHSSGFVFVRPPNPPNIEIYDLGEYNRDRNILLRLYRGRHSSTVFSITMWQYPKDSPKLSQSRRLFGNSVTKFVNLSPEDRGNHFDKLEVDNYPAWGTVNDKAERSDIYLVFVEIDQNIFVIQYSVTKGSMEFYQDSFDQFLSSIEINE